MKTGLGAQAHGPLVVSESTCEVVEEKIHVREVVMICEQVTFISTQSTYSWYFGNLLKAFEG